jgi:hypothetical protein
MAFPPEIIVSKLADYRETFEKWAFFISSLVLF